MVNITNEFRPVFTTYSEVKKAHPDWSDKAIEDYLSIKDSINITGDTVTNINIEVVNESVSDQNALLFTLMDRVGSGDELTSDETGFTVDTDLLSVDMTEA